MKELSNELKWPELNIENVEKLYIYCTTKDDNNTVPATDKDFLASNPAAYSIQTKNTLNDYFFEPKFFEAGVALRFMLGQLKSVHEGKKESSVADLTILYNDVKWCEPDSVEMEKFISMCVGSRLLKSVPDSMICDLSNPAITPRSL